MSKLIEAIRNQAAALRAAYGQLNPENKLYGRLMLIAVIAFFLWLCISVARATEYSGMTAISPNGATVVTLRKLPCTDTKVLVFISTKIKPRYRDGFHVADLTFHGMKLAACWRATEDGALIVVEDGSAGVVPYDKFSPVI